MSYPGGQYQGLGLFAEETPPPPRRTGRIAAIAVAAIVVIVGSVVALLLVTGRDDNGSGPGPSPGPTTTTTPTPPKTTTSAAPPGNAVPNDEAHIAYSVPDTWTVLPPETEPLTLPSMSGLSITGLSGFEDYDCEGKNYSRGFAGSGTAPDGEINKVANDIAHAVATDGYSAGGGVQVSVGTPKPVTRTDDTGNEVEGVQVEATVTTTGSACLGTKGVVFVTVLKVADNLRFVLVNGDIEGGPADPAPPTRETLLAVADSARPLA